MSSTNAPQPDPAASAAAEVFDSTVTPSQGQVSATQGQGPSNVEGPMHAGELNTIDQYFFMQFIALTSFIWDTSMSPGQLVWSIPIHPTFVHQFMAHLSKMYNAFVGGFDFSITIAGTGFHAGKLLIVRLPPNIRPESLHTIADITAFPYMVIDPKTLETVVKSTMDQRNVMYHYLPFNANDYQTFGGYLAMYVLLPLNTSSTGATQISVQVLSRPARDFMFTQIRPINPDVVNVYKPVELEQALDFRSVKTNPLFATNILGLTAFTATDVRELLAQTWNCVKLNREAMNGDLFDRYEAQPRIATNRFNADGLKSFQIGTQDNQGTKEWFCGNGSKLQYYFSFDGIKLDSQPTTKQFATQFLCKTVTMTPIPNAGKVPSRSSIVYGGTLRTKLPDDPEGTFKYVFSGAVTEVQTATLQKADTIEETGLDLLVSRTEIDFLNFTFYDEVTFDADAKPYAPPIPESVVTFQTMSGDTVQPHELKNIILSGEYEKTYKPTDSLIFELMDDVVDLPLIPLKLHFNGYFTTLALTKNLVYKFEDPKRYYLRYIGTIPESTPMVGGRLPISSAATYHRNATISRLA